MIVVPIKIKNQVIMNISKIITNKGFLKSFFNPDMNLILCLLLDFHLIFVINHNYILKYYFMITKILFFMFENIINSNYDCKNYEKPNEYKRLNSNLMGKLVSWYSKINLLQYLINLNYQFHDNYK